MDGCHSQGDSAWQLLQLTVEKLWAAPGGPVFPIPAQMGVENPSKGYISVILGSFQSRRAFSGQRALTVKCLLMNGSERSLLALSRS